MKRWCLLIFGLLFLTISGVGVLLLRDVYGGSAPDGGGGPFIATSAQIARGEYLARVGNCAGCHTPRGGEAYAGGRAVETPFGAIYASNLTPNAESGIGAWSSSAFFRAMHEGRSRDGRLLYPAFPYPNMTLTTREDSDAIYAYLLNGVKPVAQPNRAHTPRGGCCTSSPRNCNRQQRNLALGIVAPIWCKVWPTVVPATAPGTRLAHPLQATPTTAR